MLFITSILPILVALLTPLNVVADEILLKAPKEGDVYYSGSRMKIEYQVRFDGMAALASAAVSLAYAETLEIVALFPNATWQHSSDAIQSGYDLWKIPTDIKNGTYILRVAGPATYPCSHDGRPPYRRCDTDLQKTVSIVVLNT